MQAFGKILNDADLANIISYVRQSWGNDNYINERHYKLEVSPDDVRTIRKKLQG